MNFWHMQLHPGDREAVNRNEVKKILKEKGVIGLGDQWPNDGGQPQKFQKEIRVGDVVLIRSDGPLALVKIISDCYQNSDNSVWFDLVRKIEILSLEGSLYKKEFNKHYQASWTDSLYLPKTIEIANNSPFIKFWYQDINGKVKMDNVINLLTYKHQIVLQGPPGTGKTRLAKLIAEKMTNPKGIGRAEDIVDKLIQNFNVNDKSVKEKREKNEKLLSKFCTLFPKEELHNLTLDQYCVGRGDQNNFCWWIETGLESLGKYNPGRAKTYLIYWKKELEDYSKHGFIKDEDNNGAINKIGQILHELVCKEEFENAKKYLGNGYILKILNSYYPEKYFPINNEQIIEHALEIFQVNFDNLDFIQKNKKLNEVYLRKKEQFFMEMTSIEFSELLWKNFNLKKGENINKANEVLSVGEYQVIQFHPAYSYEDFVRGIVAEANDNGNISYKVENKILAEFAKKAQENPNGKYVLIIDEINRANLPSVLGELIYALEYRGEPVTTMYEFEGERQIILPKNLYIIGTMNTADRSVGHIDYAIRRRFAFMSVLPDEKIIENEQALNIFKEVVRLFEEHLSADFQKEDVMIGHSYFLVKDKVELAIKLEYEIKPILKEYLKDGVLNESASKSIENLRV